MSNESQIATRLLRQLNLEGMFFKTTGIIRAGVPDIVGVSKGRFYAIEVKANYNKPTPLQRYHLKLVADNGGIAVVITYIKKQGCYRIQNTNLKTTKDAVRWILNLKQSPSNINAHVSKKQKKGPTTDSY